MDCKTLLTPFSNQPISTQVLLGLLRGYSRPYDKIGEMVHQGFLLQVRKGLYVTTTLVNPVMPEKFLIANHLYGPSYVSIDSAMSFWGLIPEKVFEITSVTVRPTRKIDTLDTVYSFLHIPKHYYALGIQSVALTEKQTVMMACPEKCICDKIVTTSGINLRSRNQALEFLTEDLRIDAEHLSTLQTDKLESWLLACPKKTSITNFIEAVSAL